MIDKIYTEVRGCRLLDAESTEVDDNENFRGVAPLYICLCQHQTPDKGSRLPSDTLAAHDAAWCGGGLMIKMVSPILYTVMWEKQDIVGGRVHGVSILQFPKMERLRVVPFPLLVPLIG